MKISKRLETIAKLIPSHSKVIDVGCDHALLDIYLSQEKECECIATDINQNALDQARYNILRSHVETITIVNTDGLEGIDVSDRDIIVISGMGTATIEHILEGKKLSNRMIIGTQTDFEDLRRYVISLGYYIQDEKYVEEKGKSYIIIDFVRGKREYQEEDYRFGPILKKNLAFLLKEEEKTINIIEKIPAGDIDLEAKQEFLKELENLKNRL